MPPDSTWWQPQLRRSQSGPDETVRRPCGCRIDPVVFGHWHPGRQAGEHDG